MMAKTVPGLLIAQVGVMKRTANGDLTSSTTSASTTSARMGVGSWIILIVLLSLLVATGVVIYFGWTLGNGTDVPTSGYAAMALGVIVSLAVGFGLMALLFYSSRKGYDEPPVMIVTEDDSTESRTFMRSNPMNDRTKRWALPNQRPATDLGPRIYEPDDENAGATLSIKRRTRFS